MKIKGSLKNINKISNDTADKLLIPAIEEILRNLKAGVDRGHGWNSPSSVGYCSRSVYFGRIGLPPDFPSNEPRLQRILIMVLIHIFAYRIIFCKVVFF